MRHFAWILALFSASAMSSGVTTYLAAPMAGDYKAGRVYSVADGSQRTTIYDFCSGGGICLDGRGPMPSLTEMDDGTLIGATQSGGLYGAGVIFRLTLATNGWVGETLIDLCEYFDDCQHYGPIVTLRVDDPYNMTVVTQTPQGHGARWRLELGPPAGLTRLQSW